MQNILLKLIDLWVARAERKQQPTNKKTSLIEVNITINKG